VTIEIANPTGRPVDVAALQRLAEHVMAEMRVHPESELSIVFVDPDEMAALHEQWMDEPGPTDVMSFPMDEVTPAPAGVAPQAGVLGDIVICWEVAEQQAATAGHPPSAEVELLLAHGLLHLLGYDHADPVEERVMFAQQADLLASWRRSEQR
jgi:probable rRNA maturation factor